MFKNSLNKHESNNNSIHHIYYISTSEYRFGISNLLDNIQFWNKYV